MHGSYAGTYYPHLREVLDARYAGLSDEELEEAFTEAFGENVTPAEYEEFFKGLGSTLSQAAQHAGQFAQTVGPGLLQGAKTGSALGPYGAIAGALAGATGSALQRYGGRDARRIGSMVSGALNTAGTLTGRGGLTRGLLGLAGQAASGGGGGLLGQFGGLPGGQGGPASGALGALLRRPEMGQALAALTGGRNTPIPVGRQQVPVPANAFAGLLGALAGRAEMEWAAGSDFTEAEDGEQAGQLFGLLVRAEQEESEEADDESDEMDEYAELDDAELDEALIDDDEFAAHFDELVSNR